MANQAATAHAVGSASVQWIAQVLGWCCLCMLALVSHPYFHHQLAYMVQICGYLRAVYTVLAAQLLRATECFNLVISALL